MIFSRKYGYNGLPRYRPQWVGIELESKRWLPPDRYVPKDDSRIVGMSLLALAMVSMPILGFVIGKLM